MQHALIITGQTSNFVHFIRTGMVNIYPHFGLRVGISEKNLTGAASNGLPGLNCTHS